MNKTYAKTEADLLNLFEPYLTPSDVLASKALAEIAATITASRIQLNMTQKEFAHFLGVSQGMVSRWESTDYNFSIKSLADICAKLNLDLHISFKKCSSAQTEKEIPILQEN